MTKSHLYIFDIDGTLIHSKEDENDDKMFCQSLSDLFNITNVDTNWESYQYSVDYGLITEIFTKHLYRNPNDEDLNKLSEYYYQLQLDKSFFANKGSLDFIAKTKQFSNIAIATGNLKKVALLKLTKAGFTNLDFPVIGCDGFKERSEIITHAILRSQEVYRRSFKNITYFGDRIWDFKACQTLDIDFIGIGQNNKMKSSANRYYDNFDLVDL